MNNIKTIIKQVLISSTMFGIVGIIELWFYDLNLQHGIAAFVSGAFFGTLLGIFGPSMFKNKITSMILCALSGGLSGIVWWLIAKPDVSIYISIIIGVALGTILVVSEYYWASKRNKVAYNEALHGIGVKRPTPPHEL